MYDLHLEIVRWIAKFISYSSLIVLLLGSIVLYKSRKIAAFSKRNNYLVYMASIPFMYIVILGIALRRIKIDKYNGDFGFWCWITLVVGIVLLALYYYLIHTYKEELDLAVVVTGLAISVITVFIFFSIHNYGVNMYQGTLPFESVKNLK